MICVDASGYISRTSIEALPQNELVISGDSGREQFAINSCSLVKVCKTYISWFNCVYVFATGMGMEAI